MSDLTDLIERHTANHLKEILEKIAAKVEALEKRGNTSWEEPRIGGDPPIDEKDLPAEMQLPGQDSDRKRRSKLARQVCHIPEPAPSPHHHADSHAGDCTFYSAMLNGRPEDGICTCGYGWSVLTKDGDRSKMYSEERTKTFRPPEPAPEAQQEQERINAFANWWEKVWEEPPWDKPYASSANYLAQEAFAAGYDAAAQQHDAELARLRDALRWRDAKDKPGRDGEYLVLVSLRITGVMIMDFSSFQDGKWDAKEPVIYWMPKPPLPQEAKP